jgi:hypothetical protein
MDFDCVVNAVRKDRDHAGAARTRRLCGAAYLLVALSFVFGLQQPALALVEVTGGTWGAGDHNADGTVDGRDYVIWREANSMSTVAYDRYRENVGNSGTSVTTQPPVDDPGWDNVSMGATRNFVYLKDGWALSAWHVGPDPGMSIPLMFGSGIYNTIPNQNYVVKNPTGMGLSTETDLRLVRIDGDPESDPINPLSPLVIASTQPMEVNLNQESTKVTVIGQGRTRLPNSDTWNGHQGYYGAEDFTKRWGMNRISDEDSLPGQSNDNDLRITVLLEFPNPSLNRHVVSMITYFDQSGISYESQAVDRDSGSGVFRKNGSQWELIGIVNTNYQYTGQPSLFAAYGNATAFADMTLYNQNYDGSISDIMADNAAFSKIGDVNLDGKVTGDGTGSWASDDVTAFLQGWNYQQGDANVTSWKKGDLNLDGITNAADSLLMQNALNSAGLGAGASALAALSLSPSFVPEPSVAALAGIGALWLTILRRRRSRECSSRSARGFLRAERGANR